MPACTYIYRYKNKLADMVVQLVHATRKRKTCWEDPLSLTAPCFATAVAAAVAAASNGAGVDCPGFESRTKTKEEQPASAPGFGFETPRKSERVCSLPVSLARPDDNDINDNCQYSTPRGGDSTLGCVTPKPTLQIPQDGFFTPRDGTACATACETPEDGRSPKNAYNAPSPEWTRTSSQVLRPQATGSYHCVLLLRLLVHENLRDFHAMPSQRVGKNESAKLSLPRTRSYKRSCRPEA